MPDNPPRFNPAHPEQAAHPAHTQQLSGRAVCGGCVKCVGLEGTP
jgi:hypothetical protein